MPKSHSPYPLEFRRRIIELVRSGRSPEALSKEFEPTAQSIHNWVAQADRDEGRRNDGLTTEERKELVHLRRENKQLRMEREILSKAAAWFARETGSIPERYSDS
jgi:transposase